ncbi:hypothetical protein NRB_49650 [Novosphingobium sp. 11B]
MRVAEEVQVLVAGLNAVADPAVSPVIIGIPVARLSRRCAFVHDLREGAVAGHLEPPALERAGEGGGYAKPIERQRRAQARFDPEDLRIVARVGHGKYPAAIGEHQEFRLDDRI